MEDGAENEKHRNESLENGASGFEAVMTCLAEYGLKKGADRIIRDPFQEGFEHPYGREDMAQGNALVVYEPKNNGDLLTAPGNGDTLKATGGTDFYVAPGGETIPAAYESWIGENQRDAVLEMVEDEELREVVQKVYVSGSAIGNGSISDYISFAKQTNGVPVTYNHMAYSLWAAKRLENLLNSSQLRPSERQIAMDMYYSLKNVIGGK